MVSFSMLAYLLACKFQQEFARKTQGLSKNEVPLFQAMQRALEATANSMLQVEKYHGFNHQVTFTGFGSYSRPNARCELSDLMVIVFDRSSKDARLTYIQAKSERKVPASNYGLAGKELVANLEQWDLLARRPRIVGVGKFQPPPDLLQRAQLESCPFRNDS